MGTGVGIARNKKNLTIVNDRKIHVSDGRLQSNDTFPNFLPFLSAHFQRIYYCAQVVESTPKLGLVSLRNVFDESGGSIQLVATEPYEGVVGYYRRLPFILRKNLPILRDAIRLSDVVLLPIPNMNAFLSYLIARAYGRKVVTYAVGNQKEIIRSGTKYSGVSRALPLLVANMHDWLLKRMMESASAAIFLSKTAMENCAIRDSFFTFTSLVSRESIVRRTIGAARGTSTRLLYVGRLSHEKGLKDLLEALVLIRRQGIDARLNICGEGGEKQNLIRMTKTLALAGSTEFLGAVPWGEELEAKYLESDILVLPSRSEGLPKVLLEAMAKGLVIVATSVGGIPDIIQHGENGILVPPENPQALASAISELVTSGEYRRRLVQNGYEYIEQHTAEKQAMRTAEIINSTVG